MTLWLRAVVLLTAIGVASYAVAQGTGSNQQNMVKSVFLLNITKFVDWPDQAYSARPTQLLLCQYREDLLGIGFEIIRNRSVNGRKLAKRTIESLGEIEQCDALYIAEAQYRNLYRESLQLRASKLPIKGLLVIVDQTAPESGVSTYSGVHVILFRRDEKIAFSVNLQEAERSQLTFDKKLIGLSTDLAE